MKKIILFLIVLVFVSGCSQRIEVKGEVREPRTFSNEEILSLESSDEIIFWHLLRASGCITGYARDVVVYGKEDVVDLKVQDAYKDNVTLVYNDNGFDLVAPGINLKDVYKIEVVNYDYE